MRNGGWDNRGCRRKCEIALRFRLSGSKQSPGCAGRTIGIVVRMVKRRARFFDVRPRIRPLPSLEERGERKQKLGDGEEENRRSPKRSREDT